MSEPMTLSQAVAEAGKFGNTIRAFAKLQEVAEVLYAQEQAQREREAKLDNLQAEIVAAQSRLDEARDSAESILASARDAAHAERDKANADVLVAQAEAQEAADSLVNAIAAMKAVEEAQHVAEQALAKALADEAAARERIKQATAEAVARIGG